jgi:hypothetical protein
MIRLAILGLFIGIGIVVGVVVLSMIARRTRI